MRTLVVSEDLRAAIIRLAERLGSLHIVAATDWQHLLDQCEIESAASPTSSSLVVGPPAFVLKHAMAATASFGFVMPVAQQSKLWQRSTSWRDDATLDLWRVGWSPQAIDRIRVPTKDAIVEFVIGDVRRIPSVAGQPDGSAPC